MLIGILGTGNVAQSLAKGFIHRGDTVTFGTRDPHSDKAQDLKYQYSGVGVGTFQEVVQAAEVVILALKGEAVEQTIRGVGVDAFSGKVIMDITNPLDFSQGMPPKLFYSGNTSLGEEVQKLLPKSHVVKTLNIINHAQMVRPNYEEGKPVMFLCGDSDFGKDVVTKILEDFGWEMISDLGGIEHSREMETMCLLWVVLGLKWQSWSHAFALLKN